jgi:hypothetical protein
MRRLVSLLALAPFAALASACGSSGVSDPVAKAATASANAKAEHMHLDSTVTANGTSVSVEGDGDFANDPLLGSMALHVVVGKNDITMSEVASGTTVYLTSPAFKGQIAGGKRWLSVDYGKVAKSAGVSILSAGAQSPTDTLQQLEASGKAKKVGEETIGGVHTTHWTATVDAKKAATRSTTFEPVDVWIDDQGRVVKTHVRSTTAQTGTTPAVSTDSTVTFSDYGEAIHVSVPPAADVYDATALAMQATSTNGGNP